MSTYDHFIATEGFDWVNLLAPWRWLLSEDVTPWLMNRFGDVFLVSPDGAVHLLDVSGGTVETIATSRDDFRVKLDQDDNADQWLAPLVDRMCEAGVRAGAGRCYGYKVPPVLGGEYSTENVTTLPIAEHLGFNGTLHEQLRDLPDGTTVQLKFTTDS